MEDTSNPPGLQCRPCSQCMSRQQVQAPAPAAAPHNAPQSMLVQQTSMQMQQPWMHCPSASAKTTAVSTLPQPDAASMPGPERVPGATPSSSRRVGLAAACASAGSFSTAWRLC
jgi:hypothetical protein